MSPPAAPAKTLVVGFDGSEADALVSDVALDLAQELGAGVLLVRAVDMASDDPPVPESPVHEALHARVAERVQAAMRSIDAKRARLEARAGGRVEIRARLVERRPFEALCEVGEDVPDGWVVVGVRRTKSVLGRTVDQVLRRSTRPVVVVPDGASWASSGTVLAGIDAGELDGEVLRAADRLARALSRRLGIVHVRTHADESAMLRVTEHTRQVAPDIAATATISVMRVEHSVARTIADHARRVGASILVVGTHGRRGLERWVLGSTAEALAHASSVPFFVVRRA